MRLSKMPVAAATAAALLALPGASALAAKHAHPLAPAHAGCHVSLVSDAPVVIAGDEAQLSGLVACPGLASASGQTVTVYERTLGSGGFKAVATLTTGTGGVYSYSAPLTANSVFYSVTGVIRSPRRFVHVSPLVELFGPSQNAALHTGGGKNLVTFTGTIKPAQPGALVILQREDSTSVEEWGAIQIGSVNPGGTSFTLTHRFRIPGDANLRVVIRPAVKFVQRGISNTLGYVISQRENPNLTLESTADPVPYGQTIELHGTVLGAKEGQKVTLTSHPRGPVPFTNAGETTTNSKGEYTFKVTALRNTAYQVDSGTLRSAVLYEGVRYVATLKTPAPSSPAGQEVTYSGTVTPTGAHVVYLEREDLGGGFHVVQVGASNAAGEYTLKRTVFGSGKQVYRIHIPGNPENQGVSTVAFPLEVTAPIPGSLHPVASPKEPTEGKI